MNATSLLALLSVGLVGCPASCQLPPPLPLVDASAPLADVTALPVLDSGASDVMLPVDAAPAAKDVSADWCSDACTNLQRIGCSEGLPANCTSACVKAQTARITDLHPECLAKAKDRQEARGCGSVRCSDP